MAYQYTDTATEFNFRHASRMITLVAMMGGAPLLAFNNGFLLAYFSKLQIQSTDILLLLALPAALQFSIVFFSYLADRYGKKRLGNIGLYINLLGFIIITASGWISAEWVILTLEVGIVLFGVGSAIIGSSWFALLSPIVPEQMRGRFFGKLRLTWQSFGIGINLIVILILDYNSSLGVYSAILGFMTLLLIVRFPLYAQIPDLEPNISPSRGFKKVFSDVIKIPSYLPFCSYCFVLMLFTGAVPLILGLLEKDILGFSDDQIVLLGSLLFAGSLAGFVIGGKMVDQIGTKYVFMFSHFAFAIILFLFLFRGFFPFVTGITMGILSVGFGFIQAVSSIAMMSEMLYLIPVKNKSFSTGLWLTLYQGGVGLSGLMSSKTLDLNILNTSWVLLGQDLTHYDSLLLIFSVMIILMVVTLGLVPSVIGKSQSIPRVS